MFNIGDIVRGKVNNGYAITTNVCLLKVISLTPGGFFQGKVIAHMIFTEIGKFYDELDPGCFILEPDTMKQSDSTERRNEMFKVGDIVIGNKNANSIEGCICIVQEVLRDPFGDDYRITVKLKGDNNIVSRPFDSKIFTLYTNPKEIPLKSRKDLIKSKLSQDELALYELTKRKRLSTFHTHLRDRIQNIRYETNDSKRDRLMDKLVRFGNKGKWSNEKMKELSKAIYQDKSPESVNLGNWLSVEIECCFVSQKAETSFVSFIRKHGWTKYVTLKNDGSVKPDMCGETHENSDGEEIDCRDADCTSDYGKEIVITFQYGNWEFVQAICAKLRELKCYVNKSCGLHVHFDCRHLTARQVTTLGKRVALCVPALHMILPKSRRENRFCLKPINTHKQSGSEGRYSFVNLQSYARHKTLEIRGHSGTTDSDKIVNWIKLIKAIMVKPNKTKIDAPLDLVSLLGKSIDKELSEYVLQRQLKFASKGLMMPDDDVANDDAVQELLLDTNVSYGMLTSGDTITSSGTSITINDTNGWHTEILLRQSISERLDSIEERINRESPNNRIVRDSIGFYSHVANRYLTREELAAMYPIRRTGTDNVGF